MALALAGPGAYSLDSLLGIRPPTLYAEVVEMVALIGVFVELITRHVSTALPQAKT